MDIKAKEVSIVDIDSLVQNFFQIQKFCKNPIRLQESYAELYCQYKVNGIWVKVSFCDLAALSSYKWKFQHNTEKYIQINSSANGTAMLMSRFILSAEDGQFVDHINRDPTDNRRENLRFCNLSQNAMNRESLIGSKFKGVYYCKQRGNWVAQITINKKTKNLGRFLTQDQAAMAYDSMAKIHYGEFAKLNFP